MRALRVVCATFVPDADARLADLVGARIARLPHAADRVRLVRLLHAIDNPLLNLLLTGRPLAFSAMGREQRERYLRGWATSRVQARRQAFQALKRLTTVTYYASGGPGDAKPAWRSIGYPGPLGAAPRQPSSLRTLAVMADTTVACDDVIVGSGAGGAVVAAELAAAGRDVVVLEKGGHHEAADFSHREDEMLDRLYDAGGLLTTRDLGIVVLQASCVGGGTVINYSTSLEPPARVRAAWAHEHGLPHFDTPEFSRSLAAIATRIGVNTAHSAPSARDQVLTRGLEALGWRHAPLPRNVRGCPQDDGCGYCGYGCRRDAKQSTLVTYLRDAADRGARIVPRARAERIVIERGEARGVEAVVDGRHRLRVRAHRVVVAAGAIHSPALLLRSGVRLPALGRFLALHPATGVFGLMDEEIRPWTGALQTVYSDEFADLDGGYGVTFETVPLHPTLGALAVPWEAGGRFRDRMAQLGHTAFVGVLLRDRDGGRVTVDRAGEPVITYRLSRYDAGHLREGIARAAELLEAAGAREIWVPSARPARYRPGSPAARATWLARLDSDGYGPNRLLLATFHQMASCRMGDTPAHSVVNPDHQVWGIRGLYAADAGVFPSASGVNPMLTVMGIAHRAAQHLAAR